jgi:hypothetical protein
VQPYGRSVPDFLRYRLLDFLPLLLALALIAGWFGLQQPLPFLQPPTAAVPSPAFQSVVPTPTVTRATAIQSLCDPKQPRFRGSLAALKARLGAAMGEPVGCERQVDAEGNTEQLTSTGLAYYRRRLNVAAFTTGWEHWALADNQLLQWAGSDVEPPAETAQVR